MVELLSLHLSTRSKFYATAERDDRGVRDDRAMRIDRAWAYLRSAPFTPSGEQLNG
jgi:hypothetical protein